MYVAYTDVALLRIVDISYVGARLVGLEGPHLMLHFVPGVIANLTSSLGRAHPFRLCPSRTSWTQSSKFDPSVLLSWRILWEAELRSHQWKYQYCWKCEYSYSLHTYCSNLQKWCCFHWLERDFCFSSDLLGWPLSPSALQKSCFHP